MNSSTLFLLDGTALAYRSYFAFLNSNLRNSDGLATGAIYGFANAIVRLIETEKPTHIAVAWDTHAPTFRHAMDDAYKANRPPQPDELRESIPYIKKMLEMLRIPSLEVDGFEADDIIGSLAESARGKDVSVFMVTPDKDFMQLVNDNIRMMKPQNNAEGFEILDREGVINFFGVPPEKVIDVLTLIGDSSDNIPGVMGIGKKKAPELINEYGSIEALIAAAPTINSKRVQDGIIGNEDRIRLSREMIVIKTDVPGFTNWEEMQWPGPNREELGHFFTTMQFKTLARKFSSSLSEVSSAPAKPTSQPDLFGGSEPKTESIESSYRTFDASTVKYHLVNDAESLRQLVGKLEPVSLICVDTETTGVDPMRAELLGIALCATPGEAYYVPVSGGEMDSDAVLQSLKPVLESPQKTYIAQNYKYDFIILNRAGIRLGEKLFDTMLAAYLVDPSQPLNMDALSMKYLNYAPISIDSLIGSGRKQTSMADAPIQKVSDYACEDADITFQLYGKLSEALAKDELTPVAETIEFPVTVALARMEMQGVKVAKELLGEFSESLTGELLDLEKQIYEEAGTAFNINSPQQLGEILFKKMKLPSGKKTATGKYSTNEAVLSQLAIRYTLPAKILEYRTLSKLRSTYVDALPPLIHPETGRIHTSYNQSVAATGRLSSSNPNLQNIPIRTQRGREIRKAFVPEAGFKLVAVDYSQIELRVIASISKDEAMIEAFRNDEDIHARTAKEIFGLTDLAEVDREYRRKAKEVNFGIPYGVSAFGLAQRLDIGNNEAKEIIESYFARFPKIKSYIDETIQFARENGYVRTLAGRRRYIPDINNPNFNVRGFAERTSINMPIQGTAADLIKIAMIRLDEAFREHAYKSRMLMQVHDELVFEVHESELEEVSALIRDKMESAMELDVPLKVEVGVADNWLEAH